MHDHIDDLLVAYRAFMAPEKPREPREPRERQPASSWPRSVLVFDTETTTDPTQRLLFGAFRYATWNENGGSDTLREGLIYADDLPTTNPSGYEVLTRYVASKNARAGTPGRVKLELMSRREFVNSVLWKSYLAGALITGFNLPFDLSRLAIDATEARGFYRGGFSLPLWDYLDKGSGIRRWDPHRPRVQAKPIDSKRAFLGCTGTKSPQPGFHRDDYRGHFLDLKTLSFALTDASHTLRSACEVFSTAVTKRETERHGVITPNYVEYCRQDVQASLALLERLRAEFDRHPIDLDPCRALSPASVAKAYLRKMGITPPGLKFRDFPREASGQAMSAYYGGRAEARIRHEVVPVVMLDVCSMYPTVNALMGNFGLLTASDVEVVDSTEDVRRLLDRVTPDRVFDPTFWPTLAAFAEIEPDGDILPVRARYNTASDEFTIGVNHVSARVAWYAAPDLIASKLLSGQTPRVRQAWRLVPKGRQKGLKPVRLGGHTDVYPRYQDFFKTVIEARVQAKDDPALDAEERKRLDKFFKVLANSGAYGIFAEINEQNLKVDEERTVRIYGLHEPFTRTTHWPEEGGEFFWPPLAALITSGARLVLALLERCISDAGGTYAFADTDSMAVVATKRGGRLRTGSKLTALSWAMVDDIVAQFAKLNPYDPTLVPGSILKIENQNFRDDERSEREQPYAFVISAKRYALFNRRGGKVRLRKVSEHGLGHLLDPAGPHGPEYEPPPEGPEWIQTIWRMLIARAEGTSVPRPSWFRFPAVSRVSISTPELLERFGGKRRDLWYADRMKPFNFLLAAHLKKGGHPANPVTRKGENPATFHLMAPFSNRAAEWLRLPWIDRGTGKAVTISTTANLSRNVARVKSYGDVVEEYWAHPEPKSAGPDGKPCHQGTTGLMGRRHVRRCGFVYISKEARKIDDVELGLVHSLDEVATVYVDPKHDPWQERWLERLLRVPKAFLAREAGISERQVRALRNGHSVPQPETARKLERAVEKWEAGQSSRSRCERRKRPRRRHLARPGPGRSRS